MKHSLTIPVVAPPKVAANKLEEFEAIAHLTTVQSLREALSYLEEVDVPGDAIVTPNQGFGGTQRSLVVTWDDGK